MRAPDRRRGVTTRPQPDVSICVHPDSAKVGIWPPGRLHRHADAVGYWHGEADATTAG